MTESRVLELLEEKLADGTTWCHIYRFDDSWMVRLWPNNTRKAHKVFRGETILLALMEAVKS